MKVVIRIRNIMVLVPLTTLLVTGCATPEPEMPVWETSQDIQLVPARPVLPETRPAVKPPVKAVAKAQPKEAPREKNPDAPKKVADKGTAQPEPPVKAPPVDPPPAKDVKKPEPLPVSPKTAAYQLRPGNPIRIDLLGIPDARVIDDVIDETGYINLMYIGEIKAAGKTSHQLEREIEKKYIDQKIYKHISVNVVVQAKQYFVRGEVQRPGSFPLTAGATLSQAIAVSGGFTEFANLKKIRLSRGGKTRLVNFKDIEKDSRKDIALEAGDTIVVARSVF